MALNLFPRIAIVPFLALALLTQGCEKNSKSEGKNDSQVAASVNGDEITVSQINAAVQRLGQVPQDKVQAVNNQALKALVDQQILVQQALKDKLDRNPNVMQALESARRQILAQAFIQTKTENTPKPADAEISDFINKHPELFSARRIYRLEEINIQNALGKADEIRSQLTASKNMNEFAQWLKAQGYKFDAVQAGRSAEQLPSALATQLLKAKPGQAIISNDNGNLVVILVAAAVSQPLSEEQAKPVAERILMTQKRREIAEQQLNTLRSAAKIEYLGDYADLGKQSAKPAAQAAPPAPPAPAATEPAASNDDQTTGTDAGAMKKGSSGL
ncbi:MAG: EpsD family peptidyl-prolyl cis-trans isomerase [Thiobacillaceae bacterium]